MGEERLYTYRKSGIFINGNFYRCYKYRLRWKGLICSISPFSSYGEIKIKYVPSYTKRP